MKNSQDQQILESRKLYLTKKRAINHYLDAFIIIGIALFPIFLLFKGFVNKTGYYNSPYFLIFLIFPAMALYLFLKQVKLLKLTELTTPFAKSENYKIAKETVRTLQWSIKIDTKGFIEAYTKSEDFWSNQDQMFSIVITDNRILVNSIWNVDTYSATPISWGQNSKNVKKFKEVFQLISSNYSN